MTDSPARLYLLHHPHFSRLSGKIMVSLLICTLLLALRGFGSPLLAQSHDGIMDDGKAAFDEADYDKALELFTQAIEADPTDAFGYGYRGNTLWYLEQYEEAIADFDQAIDLNPDYSGAFLLRGRTYYHLLDYDQALLDLSRAIALDREYDYAFAIRSEVYVDLEEYTKALADLDKAIEIYPEYDWAFAKRADVNRILGNYDAAIEDATQAVELAPDYDWAYAVRGNTYQEMEEYDKAIADFTRAIEIDPEYAWALAQRASVYQDMEEYRKAVADYTAAIEADPEYVWALASRGKAYQQLDEYAKAVADFNRSIRLDPEYEWAFAQRGLTYFYMDEFEKSIADFDRAIELAPEDGWNYAQRADSYRQLGQLEEALADFDQSIELDPDYAWAWAQRGDLLSELGRHEEALDDLNRALELSPDGEWIYEIRGKVHQALGNTKEAVADFDRAAGLEDTSTPTQPPTAQPTVVATATALPRAQGISGVLGKKVAPPTAEPEEEPQTEDEPETTTLQVSEIDSYLNAQPAVIQIEATGTYERPYEGTQINVAGRGSGVIIDPSGIAVTNAHVVIGSAILNVYIAGETRPRNARILGVDACRDLAVIQISGGDLPYLSWYDGATRTGMAVYAAGFPLGDPEYTLMSGIVARAKTDGHTQYSALDEVVMHDATILPGNSGGPLLAEDGTIVGINYLANQSLNRYFAIPNGIAQEIVAQLQQGIDIDSIGINGEVLLTDEGESIGIWVSSVASGSPAARTGIKAGDIVYDIEGIRLDGDVTMTTYCEILRSHDSTDVMTVAVYRPSTEVEMAGELNGEKLTVISTQAEPDTNPEPKTNSAPEPDDKGNLANESTNDALGCNADEDPDFADFVVMTDAFSSDENGWASVTESDTLDSRNDIEGGKLVRRSTFKGNVLGFTGIPDVNLANFWFCIQAQVVDSGIEENGIVFLFRADEEYESYYAISVSGYGDYLFQRKINGEWETLQEWTVDERIDITPGITNRFDIIGNGSAVTFGINDEIVAEFEDSGLLATGEIAFGTFGNEDSAMTVAFDDLVVLGFDDASAVVSSPEPPTPAPATPAPAATPTPTPQAAAAVAVVNVPTLNVRQGPGTGNGIAGSLSQGNRVVVIGKADAGCSWIQIQLPTGGTGWIAGTAQFVTLEGGCALLPMQNVTIQAGGGGGGGSSGGGGAAGQGCIYFENHFGSEANITLNRPSDGWSKTWKIAGKAKHTECMPPGRYTYTIDVPPPWGSINGDFEMAAGDGYDFPIYGR